MPNVATSQRHPPTATLGFSLTGKGQDMSRSQHSGDDLARLTSEIVAAFCEENPLEPAELPSLIEAVGQLLASLDAPSQPAARVRSQVPEGRIGRPSTLPPPGPGRRA